MTQQQSKTAIVTGGTKGIGLELTKLLSKNGYAVTIIGRQTDAFFDDWAAWKEHVSALNCDMSNANALHRLIGEIRSQFSTLDLLVNNAGSQTEMDFFDDGTWQTNADISAREIALNLTAPIALCHGMLSAVERAGGKIVNISSALALTPKTNAPTYCATKAGLSSFTKALQYQCETYNANVTVIDVMMALVETGMTQGRGSGKISPEQAAQELLTGIERSPKQVWIGKTKLLRIIHRIAPEISARILR